MRGSDLPFGLATSVGPLPFVDPLDAASFALSTSAGALVTVPSLATVEGSLLAQAVAGVPGLAVTPPGLVRVDPEIFDPDAAAAVGGTLEGPPFEALHSTLSGVGADHLGVRVGLLGPVTLALALRAAGVPHDRCTSLAIDLVRTRAVATLRAARIATGRTVFVCLGEPGLIGAMHPTFPLTPGEVRDLLDPVVADLDAGADGGPLLIGVHVPGRTDWEAVLSTGVSVASVPAAEDLVGWAAVFSDFLDRGGRIVWGAVPVDQPLGSGEELLWRRLSALWCELVGEGVDPLLLRTRSLVGPADGLGHFGVTQARLALDLVDSLSTRVRRQALGARLTLGA